MAIITGQWLTDVGIPAPEVGNNGDYYRDKDANVLWFKDNDTWSITKDLNAPEGDGQGTIFLSGSDIPSPDIGANGNYYRNVSNEDLWFKVNGDWQHIGNLNNNTPDGVGTVILSGTDIPDPEAGSDGNYYRRTSNQYLYVKIDGNWVLLGSLNGLTPNTGAIIYTGEGVPGNDIGSNQDYWRDTLTQDVYFKTNDTWDKIGNWGGGGNTGGGLTMLLGAGAPTSDLGTLQDYYRDTVNQWVYYKDEDGWHHIGSWAGGSGSGEVGEWNMTGSLANSTITSIDSGSATTGVSGGNTVYTIRPNATIRNLADLYGVVVAFSEPGIQPNFGLGLTGQDAAFAWPVATEGDNLTAIMAGLVNSEATVDDLLNAVVGAPTTNPVWGVVFESLGAGVNMTAGIKIVNSVSTSGGMAAYTPDSADSLYIRRNREDNSVMLQKGTDPALVSIPMDLTGLPDNQTLKEVYILMFASSSAPVLGNGVQVIPAMTGGSYNPFQFLGEADLPEGWTNGSHYRVTGQGTKNGKLGKVGDLAVIKAADQIIIVRDVSNIPDFASMINSLQNQQDALYTQVQGIQSDLTDAESNISSLQTTVSDHTDQISSLSDTVSGISSSISSMEGEISTAQTTATNAQTAAGAAYDHSVGVGNSLNNLATYGFQPKTAVSPFIRNTGGADFDLDDHMGTDVIGVMFDADGQHANLNWSSSGGSFFRRVVMYVNHNGLAAGSSVYLCGRRISVHSLPAVFEYQRYSTGIGRLKAIVNDGYLGLDYLVPRRQTVALSDAGCVSFTPGLTNIVTLDGTALTGDLDFTMGSKPFPQLDTEEGIFGNICAVHLVGGSYNVTLPNLIGAGSLPTLAPGKMAILSKGICMIGDGTAII